MKITGPLILFGLAGIVVALTIIPIRNQIKRMRTHDIFGKIIVTFDRRLYRTNWTELQPAREIQNLFPEVGVSTFGVLDAWGNAIQIAISTNDQAFNVTMVSSGKDSHFKTKDDLTRTVSIRMDK